MAGQEQRDYLIANLFIREDAAIFPLVVQHGAEQTAAVEGACACAPDQVVDLPIELARGFPVAIVLIDRQILRERQAQVLAVAMPLLDGIGRIPDRPVQAGRDAQERTAHDLETDLDDLDTDRDRARDEDTTIVFFALLVFSFIRGGLGIPVQMLNSIASRSRFLSS